MMVIRMEDVQIVARKIRIRPHKREMLVQELNKLSESRKRVKAPERPVGSVTIREAAKDNEIAFQTLARWVEKSRNHPDSPLYGKIKIIKETDNCIYLEPESVRIIADAYKAFPGRGRRTVYQDKN